MSRAPSSGYLAGLAADERRRRERERRPRSGGVSGLTERSRAWAAEHFPDGQVMAAAGEACNLKVLGKRVTKATVTARLRETRPELFA